MNNTNKVNISKRPNNIAKIKTHLLKSPRLAKLAATAPSPGPKLFKQAAAAEKAGMMSAIGGIASAGLGLFSPV